MLDRCRTLGFAAAGVCAAEPSDYGAELAAWIKRGEHGSMEYMSKNADVRADVRLMLDGARSVVMVADQYSVRSNEAEKPRPGFGRVARYARGDDYHDVIKKRLHALCDELRATYPDEQFRAFVDTAPVLERELAARCGIGWQGKHTLIINPLLGSYLLLGGIVTTLELEAPAEQAVVEDHCGKCMRCIEACPTQAIRPYSVNGSRCISYLTIEHRGEIGAEFSGAMGDWIFGCDVCQEVCPHNSERAEQRGSVHPAYTPKRTGFDLLEVLGWSEEDRRAAFKGSAMKRAKLEMMKRNAGIALGEATKRRSEGATEGKERMRRRDEETK